jgi:hypothetical protein
MLWSDIAPRKCSSLCYDHNVERYSYSKAYEDRYGVQFRSNKCVRLQSLDDLDSAVSHFALDMPADETSLKRLLRTGKVMDKLDNATRASVKPFVLSARKFGLLDSFVDQIVANEDDDPLFYAISVRALFVNIAISKFDQERQESLAAWLATQIQSLLFLCRIPYAEGPDRLSIPMFVAVFNAAMPALKIHARQNPNYFGEMLKNKNISLCEGDFAEAFFTIATENPWVKPFMGEHHLAAAKNVVMCYLVSGRKLQTPMEEKAVSMVVNRASLNHPFAASQSGKMPKLGRLLSFQDMIRLGGNRWEQSVLAQALMRHDFSVGLLEFGIDHATADQLLCHRSLRKLVQEVYGTAHEEEVRHVEMGWKVGAGMDPFYSLSCLDTLHVNSAKNKVDRQAYLATLKRINDANEHRNRIGAYRSTFLNINPQVFESVRSVIDWRDLVGWLEKYPKISGADLLDIYHLTQDAIFGSGDPAQAERQQKLVLRWIDKNGREPDCLHEYLVNKLQRDQIHHTKWAIECSTPLKYASMLELVLRDAAFVVDENEYQFFVPADGNDLRSVGKAQRHCIGGANYRQMGVSGKSQFVVVMPHRAHLDKEGKPRSPTKTEFWRQIGDGYAIQMDATNKVIQAKGRQNIDCPKNILDAANRLIREKTCCSQAA